MSGIICWACWTVTMSVLQFALIQWPSNLNKIQEQSESQQNQDQWWILLRRCHRSCRLQLHQSRGRPRMDIEILRNLLQETIDQGNLRDRHHQVIQNRIMIVLGLFLSGKVKLRRTIDQGNVRKLLGIRCNKFVLIMEMLFSTELCNP